MKDVHYIEHKGHEIAIFYDDVDGYGFDIREDNYDGDFIHSEIGYTYRAQAIKVAKVWINQYIYDQTHFTEGISL